MLAAKRRSKGDNGGRVLRRIPYAVYVTLYPLVWWPPPYRRDVWQEDGYQGVQELFAVMARQYDIPIMRRFSPSTGAFPPHSRLARYTHAA